MSSCTGEDSSGRLFKRWNGIETRGNKAMVKQVHRVPRPRASLTRSEIYIITTDPSQHVFSLKNLRQKIVVTAERNFLVARCLFFLARLIVIPAGNLYHIIPTFPCKSCFVKVRILIWLKIIILSHQKLTNE